MGIDIRLGAFAAISSLPKELAGTATGALLTFRTGRPIGHGRGVIFRDRERASLDSGLTGAGIELTPEQKDLIRGILSDPENARHVLSQFTDAMSDGYSLYSRTLL
jgi:hypothetical protein